MAVFTSDSIFYIPGFVTYFNVPGMASTFLTDTGVIFTNDKTKTFYTIPPALSPITMTVG